MDDAGSEHESGWILVEGSNIVAVGDGPEPEAAERVDLRQRGCDAGSRQHASSPLPDPHAGAGAGGRPLHLAPGAVPRLVANRRGRRVRRGPHRDRRARAVGLHDGLRPPLRLPARARGPDRGRGAGGSRDRPPHRGVTRVDGSRHLRGRPPAGRPRRGARRRSRRDRAPGRRSFTSPDRVPASSSRWHPVRRFPSPGA